jgi:MYXO-CTERM domain-containing protein
LCGHRQGGCRAVTGDRWSQGKAPSYYPLVGPPPAKKDTGVTPTQDKGVGPQPDQGPPPQLDGFIPGSDSIKPGLDDVPPSGLRGLEGGCSYSVPSRSALPPGVLLIALLGLFLVLRRRS